MTLSHHLETRVPISGFHQHCAASYCACKSEGFCSESEAVKACPSKVWSRSEYCHACFAHCQVFFSFLSIFLIYLVFLCSTFLFTCFALRLANAGPVWTHRIKWVTLLIVRGNQHWFLSLVPLECQSGSQTLVCYNSEAYTCDPLNCFEMFLSKHA